MCVCMCGRMMACICSHSLQSGDLIIEHGTSGNECFALERGEVAICLADGSEILKKEAGEIFGEVSVGERYPLVWNSV